MDKAVFKDARYNMDPSMCSSPCLDSVCECMQCTTPTYYISSAQSTVVVVLQIQKCAQCLFNCLPSFFSILFEYACRGRSLVLSRICTEWEFGSKHNWLKLDDAQRVILNVNLIPCLDLIRSVLKEGEDLRNFYIQYSGFNDVIEFHLRAECCWSVADFCQAFEV